MDEKTLIILPYYLEKAQGNELDIALKAWYKFCTFDYHFVVVGTFPERFKKNFDWVEFINCEPIQEKEGQYYPHLDIQHKMEIVKNKYQHIFNGFVRMADDFYAIKSFELSDIKTVHYYSSHCVGKEDWPKSFWGYDKWKTRHLLDCENLPHFNYTAHFPCYYEFSKLEEIWDKFDMRNESYVLEDIYYNYFSHPEPVLARKIRLGIWNEKYFKHEFPHAIINPDIKFICNSVEGWSEALENKLYDLIKL